MEEHSFFVSWMRLIGEEDQEQIWKVRILYEQFSKKIGGHSKNNY